MQKLLPVSLACLLMAFAFPLSASAQGALTRAFTRRAVSASTRGGAARTFNRVASRSGLSASSGVALRRSVTTARVSSRLQPTWSRARVGVTPKLSLRGTRNPATAASIGKGKRAHKLFDFKMNGRSMTRVQPKRGWQTGVRFKDPRTGKTVIPDAVTSRGRPIELKPNTPSGRRLGRKQLAAQERATGKKGRVLYY